MKNITITTDKETYNGILLHEERRSSLDNDFHVGNDWYNETSILLTNKGIISINHYIDKIVPPTCDCEECKYLCEQKDNCDPKTCTKCNGSSEECWIVKTIISKEKIITLLNI